MAEVTEKKSLKGSMAAKEPSAQVQEEHANLVKRLDELYEDYLGLLDEYTKTRDQLSAALSNVLPPLL